MCDLVVCSDISNIHLVPSFCPNIEFFSRTRRNYFRAKPSHYFHAIQTGVVFIFFRSVDIKTNTLCGRR